MLREGTRHCVAATLCGCSSALVVWLAPAEWHLTEAEAGAAPWLDPRGSPEARSQSFRKIRLCDVV